MYTLRPLNLPGDYPRLAEIYNSTRPEPVTAEQLKEGDSRIPVQGQVSFNADGKLIGHTRKRMAATGEDGIPVGYGEAWRAPWSPPGKMFCHVYVLPEHQHRGVGTMLAQSLLDFVRQEGAEVLGTQVRDNCAEGRRFAERYGFAVDSHMFESTLDLATFDETPFTGVIEAAEAGGIHFFTLADEPGEATERKLYELDKQTTYDIPGFEGEMMPFSEWRKWVLEGENVRFDGMIIAADGDRFAGMSGIHYRPQTGAFYTIYTGVDKAYRGRHLALALKLLTIRTARRYGATYMRTNNDSRNVPMLTVNRKLGYQPAPGWYQLRMSLKD